GGLRMAALGIVFGSAAVAASGWLLVRYVGSGEIGWMPLASAGAIVALVAAGASSFPAWRASRLSPMVAIRDEPRSMWQSARGRVQRAVAGLVQRGGGADEIGGPSESSLLADFVASARRAESPAEALRLSLAAIQRTFGAASALLFEKASDREYRCTIAAS